MSKTSSSSSLSPSLNYLRLIRGRLTAMRRDVPALAEFGERMAGPLLAGGDIFNTSIARWWPSEFGGRAGGLMGLRGGWHNQQPTGKKDVAYFAAPDPRTWDATKDERLAALMKGRANLFVIGRPDEMRGVDAKRFAGFTGGAKAEEGLYGVGSHRPLALLRTFDQYVRGWIGAGEMIAACTRGGKMPAIYMSVWLEGSVARNAAMLHRDNLVEPWLQDLFLRDWYIPPVAPGRVAGDFLGFLDRVLATLVKQHAALAQAGEWLAEAKQAGKRIWAVLVGHSYPAILNLPDGHKDQTKSERETMHREHAGRGGNPPPASDYPIEWGRSMSDLGKAFPRDLDAGDVGLHLGYGPINVPAANALLRRGVRLIHTTPYGPMADMKPHKNFLYFDLPWRPGDAEVDIPGCGVRILPGSSSAMTMAYNALLAEMAQRMGWQ